MTESPKQRRARLAEEEASKKAYKKNVNKLRASIRSDISKSSYLAVKYTLEMIENSNSQMLSVANKFNLNGADVVDVYKDILNEHLQKQIS